VLGSVGLGHRHRDRRCRNGVFDRGNGGALATQPSTAGSGITDTSAANRGQNEYDPMAMVLGHRARDRESHVLCCLRLRSVAAAVPATATAGSGIGLVGIVNPARSSRQPQPGGRSGLLRQAGYAPCDSDCVLNATMLSNGFCSHGTENLFHSRGPDMGCGDKCTGTRNG
jgi:hypothetical protein